MGANRKAKLEALLKGVPEFNVAASQSIDGDRNLQVSGKTANQKIKGNGNVQIAGDANFVNTAIKLKQEAVPGPEHISEAQAVVIREKISKIVDLEKNAKRKPRGYQAVWNAFKSKFGLTEYKFLQAELFGQAVNWLDQEVGRLSSSTGARKSPNWRKNKYAYISINVKQLGINPAYRRYLLNNFGVNSASELDDESLERAYRWVASRKRSSK